MSLLESTSAVRANAEQHLGEKFAILKNGIAVAREAVAGQKQVAVGDAAPQFTLSDAFGKPVSLADLLRQGPVVLSFYRGEWCPFCSLELKAYRDILPQIEAAGATLVAISPEKADFSRAAIEKHELNFPVLSDVGNVVARAYGLVFEVDDATYTMGRDTFKSDFTLRNSDEKRLPIPGTFVIGTDGVVRFAHASADYMTGRAEPADVLAVLQSMGPAVQ